MIQVAEAKWLRSDPMLAAQVAHRQALVAAKRDKVIAVTEGAEPAVQECLDRILDWLRENGQTEQRGHIVKRLGLPPIAIDRDDPFGTLAGLVAEDLCILQRRGDEHVLTAALLAFPSGWTLAEKIGKPMMRIHKPVPSYDRTIGARVQRMFDNLPTGRILGRANLHPADNADLFAPMPENRPPEARHQQRLFERSEWQTISRLPQSGAILFTIHVSIALPEDQ